MGLYSSAEFVKGVKSVSGRGLTEEVWWRMRQEDDPQNLNETTNTRERKKENKKTGVTKDHIQIYILKEKQCFNEGAQRCVLT